MSILKIGEADVNIAIVKAKSENLSMLSQQELKYWERDKQFRRHKLNWLSGRIAAKAAIRYSLPQIKSLNSIEIMNTHDGMPYSNEPSIHFSIAHCNGYGLSTATVDALAIGCDIEKIKERKSLFTKYFMSNEEELLWSKHNNFFTFSALQTIKWTVKESSLKCLHSLNLKPANALEVNAIPDLNEESLYMFSYGDYAGTGQWMIYQDYAIAISVLK